MDKNTTLFHSKKRYPQIILCGTLSTLFDNCSNTMHSAETSLADDTPLGHHYNALLEDNHVDLALAQQAVEKDWDIVPEDELTDAQKSAPEGTIFSVHHAGSDIAHAPAVMCENRIARFIETPHTIH